MRWVLFKIDFEASGGITNSLREAFFICGKMLCSFIPAQCLKIIDVFRPLFLPAAGSRGKTSGTLSYQNIPFPFD
jgi:hypothetical protein